MKELIFLIVLIVFVSLVDACAPAYVRNQPSSRSFDRPQRPSDTHIWLEGDWVWNRQSRTYNQRNGSWAKPRNAHSYRQGHWKTNRHGQYWVRGQWD